MLSHEAFIGRNICPIFLPSKTNHRWYPRGSFFISSSTTTVVSTHSLTPSWRRVGTGVRVLTLQQVVGEGAFSLDGVILSV